MKQQHGLGLSAFSLPKLKRDVASKLTSGRDGGEMQAQPEMEAAGKGNCKKTQQKQEQAAAQLTTDENVDPASPVTGNASKSANIKPVTARKGKRAKPHAHTSEQHTVCFDDEAAPHETSVRHQRGSQPIAPAPSPVRSQLPGRQRPADARTAAGDRSGDIAPSPGLFTSQPEPMEEDAWLPDHDLVPSVAIAAVSGTAASKSKQALASTSGQQGSAAGAIPACRKQHKGIVRQDAAEQNDQQQPQPRKASGSHARGSAPAAPSALEMPQEDAVCDHSTAGPPTESAGTGKVQLRDGQEIFKCMKQLAEDAAELLPQDEAEGGKRRGRGRPKKDLRLVDALHQSWQGKSYYERLQEITRQELQQEEEEELQQHKQLEAGPTISPMALPDEAAVLPLPTSLGSDQLAAAASDACTSRTAASKQQQGGEAAPGRKRRTGRQGPQRPTTAPPGVVAFGDDDGDDDDAAADKETGATVRFTDTEDNDAAAGCPAAVCGVPAHSSKRRATLAASSAAAIAGSSRPGRRATMATGSRACGMPAASHEAKSPMPAALARLTSGRPGATLDSTPAATAAPAGLADRPPFTCGGPLAGPSGPGTLAVGTSGAAGPAKADKGALQKLQVAFDAKCEELMGTRDQLKESQELVTRLRQDVKAHPKALQQLEKQKQALEKKLDGAARKEAVLLRDNAGLQERLGKQEEEKIALQDQLVKTEREVKALRLKLKQAAVKLEKAQALGSKLQELGAGLVADAQPPIMTDL